MPHVVKILADDSGQKRQNPVWCYVHVICGGNATFCGMEYFGYGESKATYKAKPDGKITCPRCREKIKEIQQIKL